MRARLLRLYAVLGAVLLAPHLAHAQTYPSRNVTIVVPLAAGSGMDTIVRLYAEELQQALGKPVVVENQPGAAMMIAVTNVAKAAPDGHTLVVGTVAPMSVNQWLYKKVNYDPDKDFVPIAYYVKSPFVLIANPDLGIATTADFIAKAKTQTPPFTYATPGAGLLQHLSMEFMKQKFGFEATHVPYRATPQSINDVVGGHVNTSIAEIGASLSLIRDGKLKALAVTSNARLPALPDVPTLAEGTNTPDYEAVSWHALFAPVATPKEIVDRLHAEMKRITGAPAFQKKVADLGLIPVLTAAPDQVRKDIAADREKWGAVVKKLGLDGSQ